MKDEITTVTEAQLALYKELIILVRSFRLKFFENRDV